MNKAELIEQLASKTKTTKQNSETMLDAALHIIQLTVAKGEDVKLVGFGTFSQTKRKTRKGRNPKTGETVIIPSSKVPRFKAGKEFKESLN